jgi:hypothetical protein
MAVEDDLRRLSQMQAIYLTWESFFAQVWTASNKWNNQERAGHPDDVALSEQHDCMLNKVNQSKSKHA